MKHRWAPAGERTEPEIEWEVDAGGGDPPMVELGRLHKAGLGLELSGGQHRGRAALGVLAALVMSAAVLTGVAFVTVGRSNTGPGSSGTTSVPAADSPNASAATRFTSPARPGPGQVVIHLEMSELLAGGPAVCHEFSGDIGPGDPDAAGATWLTSDGRTWPWAPGERQSLCCLDTDRVKWISLTSDDRAGRPLALARFDLTC